MGSVRSRISTCTVRKMKKAMTPETSGDTTQLSTIWPTLPHCTASMPMPTAAKPTIAPMMEWVVETGQPIFEARFNHTAAASSEPSMP